eukprot:6200076-Pleurochrysis_carterae.AAC.3
MAPTLKVYTNEDMMVGIWLVGHQVLADHHVLSNAFMQPRLWRQFPSIVKHLKMFNLRLRTDSLSAHLGSSAMTSTLGGRSDHPIDHFKSQWLG